jgi:hypothetical protein
MPEKFANVLVTRVYLLDDLGLENDQKGAE